MGKHEWNKTFKVDTSMGVAIMGRAIREEIEKMSLNGVIEVKAIVEQVVRKDIIPSDDTDIEGAVCTAITTLSENLSKRLGIAQLTVTVDDYEADPREVIYGEMMKAGEAMIRKRPLASIGFRFEAKGPSRYGPKR